MKILNFSLFLVLAIVASVPVLGQVNPAKVKVRGVGLNSTYAQVVKALGRPVKDGKPTEEGCIGAHEKNVEFAGASFYFMDGDSKNGKTFEAKAFDVTSAKYVVSGVKVGDAEAVVRRVFGRKYTVKTDDGVKSWSYEMDPHLGPGWTTFEFKNGKIVKISSSYHVC
ncbi:MAG TPA: hypothetical protein VK612_12855 [Pyrinomonadaceae bacterium]|nr:hypothetical protein [Pyrinomonadaceae bacterium]